MNSKITAFALHELSESERQELLAQIQTDPSLQLELRETQDFCEFLQKQIGPDTTPSLTKEQRATLRVAFSATPDAPATHTVPPNRVRSFPLRPLLVGIGTLAAAYALTTLHTSSPTPRTSKGAQSSPGLALQEPLIPPPALAKAQPASGLAASQTPSLLRLPEPLELSQPARASEVIASVNAKPHPESRAVTHLVRLPQEVPPANAALPATAALAEAVTSVKRAEQASTQGAAVTLAKAELFPGQRAAQDASRENMIQDLQKALAEKEAVQSRDHAGETYKELAENPFVYTHQAPLSTFSTDVDTASYSNSRRLLHQGIRPQPNAIRLEEFVNYFPYSYPAPQGNHPVCVTVDIAEAPWQPQHRLARIALQARSIRLENRSPANLVFLIDVSGSMNSPERLPLLKEALLLLVDQLRPDDHLSIVTYAGECRVLLESTPGSEKQRIRSALQRLAAQGSTNGESGIHLAYEQAAAQFQKGRINRVLLCTDGDFNVGVQSPGELEKLIAEKAKSGVFLSVLGVGQGNLRDHNMMSLANRGNGTHAYLDSASEARKVLVEQLAGTLITVAKDVKIQVEFNPHQVAAYRLLGYEKRRLQNQDFNDDRKDAGDIGAGHTVTALYEIVPAHLRHPDGKPLVDDLKYAPKPEVSPQTQPSPTTASAESLSVKVRYKEPDADQSILLEVPVTDTGKKLSEADPEFQFATSVAEFAILLRGSPHVGQLTWQDVRELARKSKGEDPLGYRGEFLQLIDKAQSIAPR